MKKNNVVQTKSFDFALKIIEIYKYLKEEKREFIMSKQLLRSGTSVGANIEEAIGAQTDKDFFMKITISYKEMRETIYWIKLLKFSYYLEKEKADYLLNDADELIRIIGSIQKTLKIKLGISK
ncbi:four helix bundle protein [Chryseobacterium sp. SSA4.19]|uniref:four helix bundle protein n=1 Tax=Chryseobacterium sp. SSA4.19 TaxID=2919915 RepID=UPI001F4D763A|nr:four helix bundle protein [Chryseobacterium sp. SSA4.19]MCJ8152154.1 four helix bundle protein [Chryseobacterium sp. SSA4.19]